MSLNKLSSSYTKKGDEDSMYEKRLLYLVVDKRQVNFLVIQHTPNTGGSEAALSMYILIDTDKRGSFRKMSLSEEKLLMLI